MRPTPPNYHPSPSTHVEFESMDRPLWRYKFPQPTWDIVWGKALGIAAQVLCDLLLRPVGMFDQDRKRTGIERGFALLAAGVLPTVNVRTIGRSEVTGIARDGFARSPWIRSANAKKSA